MHSQGQNRKTATASPSHFAAPSLRPRAVARRAAARTNRTRRFMRALHRRHVVNVDSVRIPRAPRQGTPGAELAQGIGTSDTSAAGGPTARLRQVSLHPNTDTGRRSCEQADVRHFVEPTAVVNQRRASADPASRASLRKTGADALRFAPNLTVRSWIDENAASSTTRIQQLIVPSPTTPRRRGGRVAERAESRWSGSRPRGSNPRCPRGRRLR